MRRVVCSIVLSLLVGGSLPALAKAPVRRYPEVVSGEYLVWLRPDRVEKVEVEVVARAMTSKARGELLTTFSAGLRGFGIRTTEDGIERLRDDPRVYRVEENAVMHTSAVSDTTNVDGASGRWHLDRIDQREKVGETNEYRYTSDGSNVDVYVVDTGVYAGHEQLVGRVTAGADYAGEDGHPATNPCGGVFLNYNGSHGTGVASLIVGGHSPDELGVARGVTIIPVKVQRCGIEYDPPYYIEKNLIGGVWATNWIMEEILSRGRRSVVNFSMFYWDTERCIVPEAYCEPDDPYDCDHECASSLEYNIAILLNDYDAVVVASANNFGTNICGGHGSTQSPARMGYGGLWDQYAAGNPDRRLVITVGATDVNDQLESSSNTGACVGLYAPGDLIATAAIGSSNAYRPPSSGNSWSAAIVSGIAARIRQKYWWWNSRQVWNYLRDTATPLASNFDNDGESHNDRLVYISPDL